MHEPTETEADTGCQSFRKSASERSCNDVKDSWPRRDRDNEGRSQEQKRGDGNAHTNNPAQLCCDEIGRSFIYGQGFARGLSRMLPGVDNLETHFAYMLGWLSRELGQ
ncbi:hypothetical protein SAMN05216525_104239 [Bradyrhizobium sp. Gha]|nr:hypothetical protein SAMN05216525_104239 [Bradyrhizobium sp. Gha]